MSVRAYNARMSVSLALLVALGLVLSSCRTTEPPPPDPAPPDRPAGPVTRTVDGYRIQIAMVTDQSEANVIVEQAATWYDNLPAQRRHPYLGRSDLDVQVTWRAPYYRVQVGRFATRSEANEAMGVISSRFPDAFPVPARVTVTR